MVGTLLSVARRNGRGHLRQTAPGGVVVRGGRGGGNVPVAEAVVVAAGACCRNSGRRCRNARMFLVVDLDREMPYRLPVSSWEGHLHWHFRHRPKAQAATSTAASVDHSPPMRGPCDAAPPAGASDLRSYGQLRGRDRRRHRLPQAQVPRCASSEWRKRRDTGPPTEFRSTATRGVQVFFGVGPKNSQVRSQAQHYK